MSAEKLILGTVQFGLDYGINNSSGKPGEKEVFEILSCAAENNIEILDTADAYGDASELIGKFHNSSGHRFKINTKFLKNESLTLSSQLHNSIDRLEVSSVNTYFYHQFDDMAEQPQFLTELKELRSQGLIRKTGVSVYDNEQFQTAIETEGIDVIQIPFNMLDNYSKRGELLKLAKSKGKEIHARSIFLQGLFFKEIESFPPYLQPLIPYVKQVKELQVKYGENMESAALQYALDKKEIDHVIIGVDTQTQRGHRRTSKTSHLLKWEIQNAK